MVDMFDPQRKYVLANEQVRADFNKQISLPLLQYPPQLRYFYTRREQRSG
jgi:hypothetical protein